MMREPIGITGVGAITPLGHGYTQIADTLLAGKSGVGLVTRFNVTDHPSQIGAEIIDLPCPAGLSETEFAGLTRVQQATLWCCAGALQDAGSWPERRSLRIVFPVRRFFRRKRISIRWPS